MKSRAAVLLLLAGIAVLSLTGCGAFFKSPVMPPTGFTFNDTAFPVDIDYQGNDIGEAEGVASSMSILGLVSMGDCSVNAAAQNGNIAEVKHIDAQFFNVLGIYSKYETRAFGTSR